MTVVLGLALNVLVLAVGFVYLHTKLQRKFHPDAVLGEIKREVNSIIVELNQTTDRNIGLIEERIASLNAFSEKVDKRLAVLRREWEQYDTGTRVYTELKQYAAGGDRARRTPSVKSGETEPHSTDSRAGESGEQIGAAHEAQQNRDHIREQVVSLHRKGIAPNIIASRVGSTLGEVELIIALHAERG